MCRGKETCVKLGRDSSTWDKWAPLPPPDWFANQALLFGDAVAALIEDRRSDSLDLLDRIRSDELREWFVEHGQMSGKHRAAILQRSKLEMTATEFDSLRSPRRYEPEVFNRDNYHCRYCGLRLIAGETITAFAKLIDVPRFKSTGTNAQRHGVVHGFRPVADHVVPYKRGGRTDPDNLVTSCWSCNFGKDAYSIEELGIQDPRTREPIVDNWDGLFGLSKPLKQKLKLAC